MALRQKRELAQSYWVSEEGEKKGEKKKTPGGRRAIKERMRVKTPK